MMNSRKFAAIIISLLSLLFLACADSSNSSKEIINLRDRFYWAPCSEFSTPQQANRLLFHKFSTDGISNIKKVTGDDQEYVWLRLVFNVPERLKNKQLGLLISYLHFADKVWVNGVYVGGYGQFPPNEKSSLWSSHIYAIPDSLVLKNERNTVFIKVYCKGKSGISNKILLGEYGRIKEINNRSSFFQSIVYIFADGGMLFTTLLFFLIFIWRKKEREYLSFSLLCIASMIFITPFISPYLPASLSFDFSFLFFIKSTLCMGIYLITFCLATFFIEFVRKEETPLLRCIRLSILAISTIFTYAAPSYKSLEKLCPFMLTLSITQLLTAFVFILKSKLTKKAKKDFMLLNLVFMPVVMSIPIDFFIRGALEKADAPYVTLFGWLLAMLGFIIIMSLRYSKAVSQNEYLNEQLRGEVQKQTTELSQKNIKLEEEIKRAATDLEMASLVQKKFFPYPPRSLRGWDIAVSYSPLDKVSGDMYDFYINDNTLNGFSLFDVSGHGIAASLVTMLAKNIVFQSFIRNLASKETVSRTLYEINDEIIEAKGEIENYLTGLMFRFSEFNQNDECLVEMANAGHPNPILYCAKNSICDEIECVSGEDHHGAIGLDFITVSFPQINFTMAEDDVLIFYTDGLTESRNEQNEMFGKERVKKIIRSSYAKDAQSIMEDLIDAFKSFTNNVKRDDDITIVVMKRENSKNFIEELPEF